MWTTFEYQTKDKEHKQYNGRLALTLGWAINYSLPQRERHVIITPIKASEFAHYIENFSSSSCDGNFIRVCAYKWGDYKYLNCYTDEPGYIKFQEIEPIKRPAARKTKWNDRPVYVWSSGRWIVDRYEPIDE